MRSVLVIGGGPAGSVAALVLARAGVEVTLLDAQAHAPFAIGEALPPAARPLLASLGLDRLVTAGPHCVAFGNRSAWGSDRLAITDFLLHPFGHGFHLDRRRFDADLLDAARDAGATLLRSVFRSAARERDRWHVAHRADGADQAICADVVIDCSGRRAAFARRQGATRTQCDRLVACAALLRSATPGRDCDATTLIEAERDGWWYTAPLPDAARIVMFASDSDLPAARERRNVAAFLQALRATRHLGALVTAASYELATPIVVAPADTSRLDRFYGDGWLAAGDAAASLDPISSQGIMTAMQCARDAAQAVLDDDAEGYAAGVEALLARYVTMRDRVHAQESRWSDAPFWYRRIGRAAFADEPPRSALASASRHYPPPQRALRDRAAPA